MSVSTGLNSATLVGGLNNTQGARLALSTPPVGTDGLRLAFRLYMDTFADAAVSEMSVQSINGGYNHYTISGPGWDTQCAFGLGFDNTYPYSVDNTYDLWPNKGFFGWYLGLVSSGTYPRAVIRRKAIAVGNVADWCKFGNGGTGITNIAPFAGRQVNSSGSAAAVTESGGAVVGWDKNDDAGFDIFAGTGNDQLRTLFTALPANPTEGAKCTIGWEFLASQVAYDVQFRWYINTDSLAEADLLDVFTTYDYRSDQQRINESTSSISSIDSWRSGAGALILPSWLLLRYGLPSQSMILKKFQYEYVDYG